MGRLLIFFNRYLIIFKVFLRLCEIFRNWFINKSRGVSCARPELKKMKKIYSVKNGGGRTCEKANGKTVKDIWMRGGWMWRRKNLDLLSIPKLMEQLQLKIFVDTPLLSTPSPSLNSRTLSICNYFGQVILITLPQKIIIKSCTNKLI